MFDFRRPGWCPHRPGVPRLIGFGPIVLECVRVTRHHHLHARAFERRVERGEFGETFMAIRVERSRGALSYFCTVPTVRYAGATCMRLPMGS